MESNDKPIINLTSCNGVPGAHNWDTILWSLWKESNLIDTPPQSNQSTLICSPNRLFDSALNSMNLFEASDFLCIRYTYPNLEYSSIKNDEVLILLYVWTPKVSHASVCTNSKHSLVPCPLEIKRSPSHFTIYIGFTSWKILWNRKV